MIGGNYIYINLPLLELLELRRRKKKISAAMKLPVIDLSSRDSVSTAIAIRQVLPFSFNVIDLMMK